MGQMLSREDEEDELQQHELRENAEPRVEEPVERPRQRKRNAAAAAIRSRKVKTSGQGRTRRTRANPVSFDLREH
jgi:hypothetical protein